jgi:hypothetical protein
MASATETTTGGGSGGNLQVTVAMLFGAVLALVGVLGPVLGGANGELIVFGRNYLHDAVHLLSGVAGLAAGYAAGGKYAGDYNRALGVTYLLVTVLGFALTGLMADLLAINFADNVLHLVLAVAFLGVGFALGES